MQVVEVTRPVDKSKDNEPKSFGFVTFAREQVAKDLVKQVPTTYTLRSTHIIYIWN